MRAQQRKYCLLRAQGLAQGAAAKGAGYGAPDQAATRLEQNPKIQAEIARLQEAEQPVVTETEIRIPIKMIEDRHSRSVKGERQAARLTPGNTELNEEAIGLLGRAWVVARHMYAVEVALGRQEIRRMSRLTKKTPPIDPDTGEPIEGADPAVEVTEVEEIKVDVNLQMANTHLEALANYLTDQPGDDAKSVDGAASEVTAEHRAKIIEAFANS